MGTSDVESVINRAKDVPGYDTSFHIAFEKGDDGLALDKIAKAIVTYARRKHLNSRDIL